MSDKMKCYVCYYTNARGGENSKPVMTFWYRKDAIAWVKEDENNRAYEEIEIE